MDEKGEYKYGVKVDDAGSDEPYLWWRPISNRLLIMSHQIEVLTINSELYKRSVGGESLEQNQEESGVLYS